ncbi:MAG: hypothetical protein AUG49_21285 [Catenulispora sp. 13_1_20CM_3_70_7]|jgi:hypothetical protein|nr:hypothetical protein [Catenulisporales bacterium]OLE21719.1 MAG: hypothetical protein AUG49_21285 [Catenulispora sp. 13_1_20CM_3_70_7]
MTTTRIRLTAVIAAALVAASAGTAAATQHHAPAAAPAIAANGGIAYLPAVFDLQPTASGTWSNTGLEITLPRRGTYDLDANVRGRLGGTPAINTYIVARLWNATSGAVLSNSERLVDQIIDLNPGSRQAGDNTTAPISERITVSGPTTIRVQAKRVNAVGASSIASIYSDGNGVTSLRYEKVAP